MQIVATVDCQDLCGWGCPILKKRQTTTNESNSTLSKIDSHSKTRIWLLCTNSIVSEKVGIIPPEPTTTYHWGIKYTFMPPTQKYIFLDEVSYFPVQADRKTGRGLNGVSQPVHWWNFWHFKVHGFHMSLMTPEFQNDYRMMTPFSCQVIYITDIVHCRKSLSSNVPLLLHMFRTLQCNFYAGVRLTVYQAILSFPLCGRFSFITFCLIPA